MADNKIAHLLLPRKGTEELPTSPITVTFKSKLSNAEGTDPTIDADATHIKLTPEIVDAEIDALKLNVNDDMVKDLASRIGVAKTVLNTNEFGLLAGQVGLRGGDGSFSGGKKSKSKKHAKSKKHPKTKKRKSVRRR